MRHIEGQWVITSYREVIFDGTTNFYELQSGEANFNPNAKSKTGELSISWKARHLNDTTSFSFSGNFNQISERSLALEVPNGVLDCTISRQLKKDMTLELIVNSNRKSILNLKKK